MASHTSPHQNGCLGFVCRPGPETGPQESFLHHSLSPHPSNRDASHPHLWRWQQRQRRRFQRQANNDTQPCRSAGHTAGRSATCMCCPAVNMHGCVAPCSGAATNSRPATMPAIRLRPNGTRLQWIPASMDSGPMDPGFNGTRLQWTIPIPMSCSLEQPETMVWWITDIKGASAYSAAALGAASSAVPPAANPPAYLQPA